MSGEVASAVENDNGPSLADLAARANGENSPAAWADYRARVAAMTALRDKLRVLHAAGATALGARLGRLPGVVVESSRADDFGMAELRILIRGKRLWTRPVRLGDARSYARLRDAIAAHRRKDWDRARNWLSPDAPPCRSVWWGGIEQIRLGESEYGRAWWR